MVGQKLIKTLQTLDSATFRRLGDAFASPYFTSSPLLLKLYALLKKEYPVFDNARLDKEKVFKALYPGKPFNDGALRVLVREFSKVTEDFIVFESLKNNEFSYQKALKEWYGEQNLYAEFEKSTMNLLAKMDQQPYRDVEYFGEAAGLYASYFFHQHTEKYTLEDPILTSLTESVDRSYILLKMRLASEMKNRERILSKQYAMPLLNEALAIGAAGLLQDNLSFRLYRLLLTLYETEENQEAFQALKDLLSQQIGSLRYFDQSMLLSQLINYAVRQLNQGKSGFNKEIFELYQLALAHELLLSNGVLEAIVYRNIVLSGCKEKAFDWTEKFIHDYEPFLEADKRLDSKWMALALLCFHRMDYDGAIDLISKHQFSDILLQLNTRIILSKAWFEKFIQDAGHFELLIYQLDAVEKFIRRNKLISRPKKEEHLNFILTTRHLATFMVDKKPVPEIRDRLEKQLNARQRMVSRDWIELKIAQYQNKQ